MAKNIAVVPEAEESQGRRYKDFDAALQERAGEKVVVRVQGHDYELAAELPAQIILNHLRFLGDGGTLPAQYVPTWLETLVGKPNMEKMLADGMTWNQLEDLTNFLLAEYGLAEGLVEEEGESDDPK